ncbi:MAG: DNA-3-methyladenine glycosylase [Alphaproteobacteria bacterium]|nr:DNA-3-methyladenine glycosylase [Alphaproteobacteria bacterium]
MRRILKRAFFDRPTLVVAEELIGKFLVRERDGVSRASMLTEVEAYDGPKDKASHAFWGRTPRNAVMFGPAGVLYVYFTYGMHHMLNVTTGPEAYPAAILIRGVEGISGPGRLTKALGITRDLDRLPAAKATGLWFEDSGVVVPPRAIRRTGRIGVSYAGPLWSKRRYRFVWKA